MSEQEPYRPRFMEIPSFMRMPIIRHPSEADVVMAGIPFDLAVTNRPGARHGPRQVRDMSSFMRATHHASHITPTKLCRIGDIGDTPIDLFSIERSVDGIERFYRDIHEAGATPLSVGGDHLSTLPILRGIARERPVGLVHFDAHCDTGGPYMGTALHHGATFKLAVEEGLLDPQRTIQIGIRGSLNDEHMWQFSYDSGMRVIAIEEFNEMGVDAVIEEARRVAGDGPTYISFDVDGLDPVYAPGTGTPEAGGFTMFEAQRMIRGLRGLNLIGADVVEVSPPFDASGNTALNAATILFEILCVTSEAVARRL